MWREPMTENYNLGIAVSITLLNEVVVNCVMKKKLAIL